MEKYINSIFITLMLLPCLLSSCSSSNSEESSQKRDSLSFTKHIVHDEFISEGVATGDVNKDGQLDILAGFYWFEAPDWTPHEIDSVQAFDYTKGYSRSFLNFTQDVNQDGWIDFIRIDFPGEGAYWYENPQREERHWTEHFIDSNVCNESPMMVDVDDDGRMDLVFGHETTKTMMWFRPPAKGETAWTSVALSEDNLPGTTRFSHGLGFSDVNGDGRKDIIIREGWWEAPENRADVPWTFHAANLGEPCSQMYTFDFDADGDLDVISASAHAYGIWWHEQLEKPSTFSRHLIDTTFSQTHGAALIDMNGDNLPDLITGKRFFAHQGKDPGGLEPPVLYWFELQRDTQNQPQWVRHLIDDESGVGLQVVIEDLNGDGKLDILNANKKGVIYFLQE